MSLQQFQLRWRLASRSFRIAVLSMVVSAVALLAFAALNASSRIDPTAASVLVAVIFGSATVLQQRQTQRRQHTVKMLTSFQSSERLAAADTWMSQRIRLAEPVGTDVDAADEIHVITLLDYYEFLSVLAQRGMVDIPLLLDLRGGTMTRCFHLTLGYIVDRRARIWPGLYSCLEAFAEVYARRNGVAVPRPRTQLDATPGDPVTGGGADEVTPEVREPMQEQAVPPAATPASESAPRG